MLVCTILFAKKQNYLLLNFLKNKVLKRNDVYLVEGLCKILSELLCVLHHKQFRRNYKSHLAIVTKKLSATNDECYPRICEFRTFEFCILEDFVCKLLLCSIVILITYKRRIADNKVKSFFCVKTETMKIQVNDLRIVQAKSACLVCLCCFVFNCSYSIEEHVFITHTLQEHTITTTWLQYVSIFSTINTPMQYE